MIQNAQKLKRWGVSWNDEYVSVYARKTMSTNNKQTTHVEYWMKIWEQE